MATNLPLNRWGAPLVAAATLFTSACSFRLGDSTTGARGAVEFEYTGWSCLFGCSMTQPLLAGTKQKISVQGDHADDAGVVASSTNPSVAEFEVRRTCDCVQASGHSTTYMSVGANGSCKPDFTLTCENEIEVHALAAGQSGLVLKSASGDLIDATSAKIADAASATLHGDDGVEIGDSLDMKQGDDLLVTARLVDAEGRELLADEGVSWTVEGGAVASGWCLLCSSDATVVRATETGEGTVSMRAAGASAKFTVRVAP